MPHTLRAETAARRVRARVRQPKRRGSAVGMASHARSESRDAASRARATTARAEAAAVAKAGTPEENLGTPEGAVDSAVDARATGARATGADASGSQRASDARAAGGGADGAADEENPADSEKTPTRALRESPSKPRRGAHVLGPPSASDAQRTPPLRTEDVSHVSTPLSQGTPNARAACPNEPTTRLLGTSSSPRGESKKRRLSDAACAAVEGQARVGGTWAARKRRRSTLDKRTLEALAAFRAREKRGDAEASTARHDEEENDDDDDEENDKNQYSTPSPWGNVDKVDMLVDIAIGAVTPPPTTPATPVTPHFRRRLTIASPEGVQRLRGDGDLLPQVAVMMSEKQIADFQNEENDARGDPVASREKTLKIELHRRARLACEAVGDDYLRKRRAGGVEARSFAQVLPAWVPSCAPVMTPHLRKLAAKHAEERRDVSIEGAVCGVVDCVGEIIEHGELMPHNKSVDDIISASVTDETIFAADGEKHHRQGHFHRVGVSTGETNAHQDQSIAGVTVAFAMVLPGEDPTGVAHQLLQLHYLYNLYPEGAFKRGPANGSSIESRARHGAVTRVETHGNTRCGELRVMTISPIENAIAMHRIANPKGAARVVIQLVIDSGLGLEWAESVAAYIRRFLGQRLMNPTVAVTEMPESVRKLLSKNPNDYVRAEVPVITDDAKAQKRAEKAALKAARAEAERAAAAEKAAEKAARAEAERAAAAEYAAERAARAEAERAAAAEKAEKKAARAEAKRAAAAEKAARVEAERLKASLRRK